jgi:hypothetical protein
MSNIPGASNALPGVFTNVITQSSGVAIPGGSRVVAMIGQGSTNETIISQARGGGVDGLDPTYTTTTGADGRHFALTNFPLVPNRTTIFKNGVPLTLLELGPITPTTTFPFTYGVQLDPATGHILLQQAFILNQGGANYVPLNTNVGLGSINSLTLVDADAPPETWTVRCVGVQRNAMNQPIGGTAQFLAFGSVSGSPVDANGNPIVWVANGQTVSNGILSFNITETVVSGITTSPFVPGDGFTIIIESGVLVRGDTLTSTEIPVANINLPTLTQGISDVTNLSGPASLTNNLSLGAQLLYANNASSMIALQAAPPLPRRTSYVLDPSVDSTSTDVNDYIFPFPLGVVPAIDDDIHVFVTNPVTGVETQLLPNQYPFYTISTPQNPIAGAPSESEFIFSSLQPPAGYSYDYSIINGYEVTATQFDGYIARLPAFETKSLFSSAAIEFDNTYVGQLLVVLDPNNAANNGTFNITAVSNGQLSIQTITVGEPGDPIPFTSPSGFPDFTSENHSSESTPFGFQVISIATGLPVAGGSGTDGTLVAFLNTATATLTSAAQVHFATVFGSTPVSSLASYYRIQITGSQAVNATTGLSNNGLYDIIGFSSLTNTVTLAMAFVSSGPGLRYEVLNPSASGTTTSLILNQNVVPNGNQLRVTIVDQRDASFYDAGWINALAALETIECDIVVPLPNQTITVIFQNALSHCIAQSNIVNRHERVLFIGAIAGLTPANLTGQTLASVEDLGILEGIPSNDITSTLSGNIQDIANYSVSDAYGFTFRCEYFYPDQIVVQAGADNVLIDGFYIAAAAAGYANADLALQNPFTNKVFSGFTILSNKMYSTLVLEQLAAAGVTTLQPVAGGGRVVWGITTSQSGFPEEQEISIVFIRDRVAKVLRAGFQGFIGTPQTANTQQQLSTEATILLNGLVSQQLITTFTGLTVIQDSVDPRQWDISVSVQPTYPLNWIYITVTVGNLGA